VVVVSQIRKDSSRIQVHRVAQFYRRRSKGVLERPKTPQTQSSLKFAGDDNVIQRDTNSSLCPRLFKISIPNLTLENL